MPKKQFLFVSVGSTDFDDLIKAVDALIPSYGFSGIMQIGHGQYEPTNLPFFRFSSSLNNFYNQATIAIAHGGLATTIEILKQRIRLVSVSNPDRYDQHQDDLISTLAEKGFLVWCRNLKNLNQAISLALNGDFKFYQPPKCTIHSVIKNFLNKNFKKI
jgi:UDP-N-acetylglucosamine transferase subunit ALG13